MRDLRNHQYEGENFGAEKVMATLYAIMFVLIVASGLHTQLKTTSDAPSPAAIEAALR